MAQLKQVGANGFQNALAGEDLVDKRRSGLSLLAAHSLPSIYRTHFRPSESEQLPRTASELNRFLAFELGLFMSLRARQINDHSDCADARNTTDRPLRNCKALRSQRCFGLRDF